MSMLPQAEGLRTYPPAGLARTEMASPRTIDEVCTLLAQAKVAGRRAVILAGGTDWIVDRHLAPIEKAEPIDLVVDVTRVDELRAIELRDGTSERRMILGGGVTYWALRRDARVVGVIPMLSTMARDVGAVQIQTRGTLGGNLATASPAADGAPALMALEGVLVLRSTRGARRVPLESFFVGYRKTALESDEIIAAIDVRIPAHDAKVTWRKVGTRLAQSISKVALAAVIEADAAGVIARARFGMASVAPVTAALPHVRALCEGKRPETIDGAEIAAALARDVTPIDDVRSTGEYRTHVARALLERALGR
jgi:CO/xanthine dehydrogenase FAD-binding subunit